MSVACRHLARRLATMLVCPVLQFTDASLSIRSHPGPLLLRCSHLWGGRRSGSPFFTQVKHPDGFHSYFVHAIMSVRSPSPRRGTHPAVSASNVSWCPPSMFFPLRAMGNRAALLFWFGAHAPLTLPVPLTLPPTHCLAPLWCVVSPPDCPFAAAPPPPPPSQFSYPSRTEDCPANFPDWGTRVSFYADWIIARVIYE